jgi:hypothetical protein
VWKTHIWQFLMPLACKTQVELHLQMKVVFCAITQHPFGRPKRIRQKEKHHSED